LFIRQRVCRHQRRERVAEQMRGFLLIRGLSARSLYLQRETRCYLVRLGDAQFTKTLRKVVVLL